MTDSESRPSSGLGRSRENRPRDHGFTLIELLVVVVILGILIAIAIPLYLNYRKGANDASAKSDLRGALNTLEQCYADNSRYPSATDVPSTGGLITNTCGSVTGTQRINTSSGTTIAYYTASAADFSGYIISATNSKGSGKIYCYQSTVAGAITTTSAAVTAYRATC